MIVVEAAARDLMLIGASSLGAVASPSRELSASTYLRGSAISAATMSVGVERPLSVQLLSSAPPMAEPAAPSRGEACGTSLQRGRSAAPRRSSGEAVAAVAAVATVTMRAAGGTPGGAGTTMLPLLPLLRLLSGRKAEESAAAPPPGATPRVKDLLRRSMSPLNARSWSASSPMLRKGGLPPPLPPPLSPVLEGEKVEEDEEGGAAAGARPPPARGGEARRPVKVAADPCSARVLLAPSSSSSAKLAALSRETASAPMVPGGGG
mmetsp:Transcript_109440/g.309627  ORF Transcript_109440/g.309627 Transcript_109440/m.309627 type:complete len:264 (-) Transcript_109440:645-1436(-)